MLEEKRNKRDRLNDQAKGDFNSKIFKFGIFLRSCLLSLRKARLSIRIVGLDFIQSDTTTSPTTTVKMLDNNSLFHIRQNVLREILSDKMIDKCKTMQRKVDRMPQMN